MAADETIMQGIIQLSVVDDDVVGQISTRMDQVQAQLARVAEMGLTIDTAQFVSGLGSASEAIARLRGELGQLAAAQAQLSGMGGSSIQLAFLESLSGAYSALIGKVAEYQALASRPVWVPTPLMLTAPGTASAEGQQAQLLAMQREEQQAVAASPFYTATPVSGINERYRQSQWNRPAVDRPDDFYKDFDAGYRPPTTLSSTQEQLAITSAPGSSAAERLTAAQVQYAAALERQTAGLIPQQRAITMGPAAPPSGPTAAYPAMAADYQGLHQSNPAASDTFLAQQLTAEQDQLAALKAAAKAEWKVTESAETQAATQEQLTRMQAESTRRQAMLGTPQEVQAAIVDPNISAAAKAQALKVKVLQIQNEQAQMNLAAGYNVLDAETAEGATDERVAKLDADLATLEQRRVLAVQRLLAGEERLAALTDEQIASGGDDGSGGGGRGYNRHGYGQSGGLAQGLMVAKYMLLYQAFSVVQQGVGTLITATEAYSLAVNQLSIALGVNNEKAATTASTYATIGQSLATPPAVAVTGATQYTRFFQDTSGAAGSIGATLGSTINLLEGKSAQQGQEQAMITKAMDELGAIAQNYGLGASGAQDLYSAATVIAQHYGQGGGSTVTTGTAQIADLLKQAGFSPEQGMALVGQVAQATGATSESAAGDLKRLLGRTGSNTFQSLFGEYGINPNQNTSKELGQLSLKFQDLTPTQQDSIITKLGGGRSGAAALATIVNFQDILTEGAKAKADPQAAEKQAQLKLGTFGGQMEQIRTDILGFATDLGQLGLGTIFGAILKGVDPLIRGLDDIVKGFNAIDHVLGPLGPIIDNGVFALATLALGVRLLGGELSKAGAEAAAGKVTGALGGMRGKFSSGGPLGFLATPTATTATPLTGAETLVAKTSADATAALRTEAAAQLAFVEANDKAALSLRLATGGTQEQKDASVADALAETSAKEKLAIASREVTATTVLQGEATKGLIAGQQEAAVSTTMAETEVATGGLGVALKGLGATMGAAAVAMAPIVAIILAIMAASAVKNNFDLSGAGLAERDAANKAGTDAMKTHNIPLAQSAANLDVAGAQKVLDAHTGPMGDFQNGLGMLKDYFTNQPIDTTAKAQVAAIQSMVDAHKKLTDWIKEATAAENKMTAATPTSALFGPGYANINTGVTTMAAQQMSVAGSSAQLQKLIANTQAGTIQGDVNVGAELTPASGDKGIAVEVTREIALAKKALSPQDQLAQLKSLLPLVAELNTLATKVADPAQRAAALDAATAISDTIKGAYYPALLTYTNDRIASIKAMSSNQGQNLTQIKALLTSSITEAAASGDVNTVVALAALGDKAFLDNVIKTNQARLTAINNSVAADVAADKIAVSVATAAGSGQSMPAPVVVDPTQKAANDKKKKGLQNQIDAFNAEEAANRSRDATLRSFQVDPNGPDANAQWLLTVQTNIETQKAILFKQMTAIDQANVDLANEQAILAGMAPAPAGSTATAGPAGAAADFGTAPTPASLASKDPKVIAANAKLAADQAKQKTQQTLQDTLNAAYGVAAPTGSAFQPGKAAADAYATEEAMLAEQAVSGDPISQAAAALRVAQYKMTESTSVGAVYWQNLKGLHDAQYALAQAEEAGSNAQLAASQIPGDPLSAATVALGMAQNQLAQAVGSTAYYTALKALHDAQYALAQAQVAAANDVDLLGIDMTNPVLMAQEKVREATRTLSMDKGRGAGTDVTNKDMVALRSATSAAQKASFDQTFSDEQTNYQLQRTSLSAYLSYLNAQHNYLTAVHSKTRQQVDELNQVDQALKSLADQMQGQFNLGQIKVPTVYEARAGTGLAQTNNVTITINGTDIPAVTSLLTQYVGQAAMSTSGSTARKV